MKALQVPVVMAGALIVAAEAETPFPTVTGDRPMPTRAEVGHIFDARSHAVPGGPQYGSLSVRKRETESGISGSEADPELFDHAALEAWWRHYEKMRGSGD